MPLLEQPFEQSRIDTIKRMLQREIDKDKPKDYEIFVDGFKIVSRTNNLEEFEEYEQEISDSTHSLSILIYDGLGTNRNTRHTFLLRKDPNGQSRSVNGLGEIDQVIAQRMEEREREYDLQRTKEKLTTTQQDLSESEEYAEQLEKKIKDMEEKRYTTSISFGELANAVLKGIIRQNVEKIPGGHALAGLLGAELPEPSGSTPPVTSEQTTASFEKAVPGDLPKETLDRLTLISQMQQKFNAQQMVAVFSILDSLTLTPEKIQSVLEFLQIQSEPHQA
jgi:hypothetical protein